MELYLTDRSYIELLGNNCTSQLHIAIAHQTCYIYVHSSISDKIFIEYFCISIVLQVV